MSALSDKVNELGAAIASKEQAEQAVLDHKANVDRVYGELRDLIDGNVAPPAPVEAPVEVQADAPVEEAPIQ